MATKEQKKKIYALGAICELLDSSRGIEDDLHLWIRQYAPDKEHISDLSDEQADFIIERLKDYSKHLKDLKAATRMSEAQKNLSFHLMYQLAEISPSSVSVRDRLAGVIANATGRKVRTNGGIFAGCSAEDGRNIIETLKRYITTEQRKKRSDKNGNVGSGGAAPP
ncbi:MAG: hypothetical protein J6A16_09620 [Oscillospiraceae bacterium]|nr:hypothetical protein [Oscillospiraceae bacterium]